MKLLPLKAQSVQGRYIQVIDERGPKYWMTLEQHLLIQTPTEEYRRKQLVWEAKVFWGIDLKP